MNVERAARNTAAHMALNARPAQTDPQHDRLGTPDALRQQPAFPIFRRARYKLPNLSGVGIDLTYQTAQLAQ
jgi:hypothetical protein